MANVLVLAAALSLSAGCGAKSISVGSVPFPAEKPVFVDETGNETAGLPGPPEPVRLVFLDSPWCPQCREAWEALGAAAGKFPPGSVRVVRISCSTANGSTSGEEPGKRPPSIPPPPRERRPENPARRPSR